MMPRDIDVEISVRLKSFPLKGAGASITVTLPIRRNLSNP